MDQNAMTAVIIFTKSYRIEGKIALAPKSRLTDFLMEAHRFIPVVDAELKDSQNNALLTSDYLSVHLDTIEVVIPVELVHKV